MKRQRLVCYVLLLLVSVSARALTDARSISLMDVPLEGPDSVFIPALKAAGFEQTPSEAEEPDTYYFSGEFYGIKGQMIVNVNPNTKLLSEVLVYCGPYRTRELYDRNHKYLLLKLQREWGDFSAKGDGSLYLLNDYGFIQVSTTFDEEGRRTIKVYYLNSAPYYKDVANMGMKGMVQEVITDNPVAENGIEHFDETGKLNSPDIIDREYNENGYLLSAAMMEPTGEKSLLTYEYDEEGRLHRRTLVNGASGIRSVNEYSYNDDDEITKQSQKVFDKQNECIVSINMKNEIKERDDNDNWTRNTLSLTYWEKGQRAQKMTVEQTRTISYWED